MEETSNVPKLRFKYGDTWQSSKLHFLADIKTGNKDLKDNVKGGKYPFFVRSNHVERINSYSFDGEAILIPGDGNVGQIYHYIIGKFDFHQRVYKISDFDSNIMGKYIYYYFQKNFLKEALRNSVKATVDSLRLPTIKNFIINYPSIKEQEKIVKMLNNIEKKINLLYKQQDALNDFKKFCLQNLFEGKLRFIKRYNFDAKYVSDYLKESKIKASNDDINKHLTVKLNLKGVIPRESKTIEKEGATTQYIRKSGQFIYGKQNLYKGALGLIPKELDNFLSSSDIPSFDFINSVNHLWFYYYFSRKSFYECLEKYSTGTGSKRISPTDFLKIKLFIPPLEIQEKIASFLSLIDKKLDLTQNQIENMEKFKKGLLQQMFV
ncbi:restriction endonuclease subunit S [Methanobrevibacter sp. UBA313]|jgi:type I restriction enzyme S subunit|uniref:restriction endonuclease subunit S n=2 Tax=unclassified Methanobrevibacter TaxID=2638681 RepID=UPI0039B9B8CA